MKVECTFILYESDSNNDALIAPGRDSFGDNVMKVTQFILSLCILMTIVSLYYSGIFAQTEIVRWCLNDNINLWVSVPLRGKFLVHNFIVKEK